MISSRTLLLSLIALNVLALAWWTGAMDPLIDDVRDPHRLQAQIQPDVLELVGPVSENTVTPLVVEPETTPDAASGDTVVPDDSGNSAPALQEQKPKPRVHSDLSSDPQSPSGLPAIGSAAAQVAAAQASSSISASQEVAAATQGSRSVDQRVSSATAASSSSSGKTIDRLPAGWAVAADSAVNSRNASSTDTVTNPIGILASDARRSDFAAGPAAPPDKFIEPQTELPLIAAAISNAAATTNAATPDIANQNACLRYVGLSYVAVRELEDELLPQGAKISMRRLDSGNYLVYIEPLASLPLARRKQEQLRRLGVNDLHIIQIGHYRNGISLGLLRTVERAERHLNQMRSLGVTTMRIGPVNANGSRYEVRLRGPVDLIQGQVRSHALLGSLKASEC